MLEIRSVTKSFDNELENGKPKPVLEQINLQVPDSQFVCLLGASGCGKTTLLRIIAGLTIADSGTVSIDGKVVDRPGQQSSLVFQNYGLLPWRTIMGNVEFGLETRGVPIYARREISQRYIDRVGLTGNERLYPHQISGGMQQRTAIARAFSKDSNVLLMDEPFAAVDMQTREMLQDELLTIWTSMKTTVIFVTHSIDEAIYLGDRVIVLRASPGRVNADILTELPRPRSAAEAKSSEPFAELQREVRAALKHDPFEPRNERKTEVPARVCDAARAAATQQVDPERPISVSVLENPILKVRKRKWSDDQRGVLIRCLSVTVTLALWEWYGRGVDAIFMSYPTAILAAVPKMLATGELQAAFLLSARTLVIGLVFAIIAGTVLGALMGRYRFIDHLFDAQISALYSTPNISLIPILILWFGLGITSKIVIVFLAAFFPVAINTYSGVRNVSGGLIEFALAEGASEPQVFGKIIIPASLPFIMTGIRLAMGRAVVGMVAGEMFTAVSGLGGAIVAYGNAFATDKLFVVIITLALLGVSLTELVKLAERRFATWKQTERAS
jgi:ABC-type nitrate/sulfonate/bicarbonate transport system ATPase subunit/ABC-type nitrate/sulfonate/bicarbonate transport system permease component